MKKIPLIVLLVYNLTQSVWVHAQYRSANAYFNTFDLGINTKDSKLLPQRVKLTSPKEFSFESSSISDEKTGELLFYTNGKKVYNPDHSLMVNGIINAQEYTSVETLIVPDPANILGYYIFYIIRDSLFYARVNMSNGGTVISKDSLVASGVNGSCLAAVSYIHRKGWWILTHSIKGNEYYSFLLLSNGIKREPVKSIGANLNANDGLFFSYTSHKGDKMLVHYSKSNNSSTQTMVVEIDKRCGRLSEQKIVYTDLTKEFHKCGTFSPDDSKIYLLAGNNRIIQFSGNNYEDSITCFYLTPSIYNQWRVLYTGLDNTIYIMQWSYADVRYYIHQIINPDLKFPQCKSFQWKTLDPADMSGNNTYLPIPNQIMDRTISDNLPDKIDFSYDNACKQFTVNFKIEHDAIYDSVLWQFGNTVSTSSNRNTSFSFKDEGDYVVKLVGYICGQADTVSKILRVREQPKPDLGNDTAVCYGSIVTLKSNIKADAYLWSDSTALEQMTLTQGGKYWLQLAFGDCKRADTIQVIQNPKIWTALGDEYYVCEDDKDLIKLNAGEKFNQYKWTPTGDTTQWIIVGDVGDYFVAVKDYRGCIGSDGTQVKRRCPVKVCFPNIFTPNNDGLNDNYAPKGKDVVTFNMKIYNRWGQLVFETNDMTKTWNGYVKGEAANADVYVYTATYSGYFNKRLKEFTAKGSFTLLH